jgi:hypothetical protein
MAPVPNRDQAIIDLAKVSDYLLSGTHPVGRAKARFFNRFGFREDPPGELVQALLDHVRGGTASQAEPSAYGTRYRVDGPLTSPNGRNPLVSSVWIILDGETARDS